MKHGFRFAVTCMAFICVAAGNNGTFATTPAARLSDWSSWFASSPPVGRKRAPGFWGHSASGQIIHIDDQFLRKKWVLVEFWSSGDKDRKKDQARMEALRNDFLSEDKLLLFSVCIDLELGIG